jgi:hypothetical protein
MRVLYSIEKDRTFSFSRGSLVDRHVHKYVDVSDDNQIVARVLGGSCYMAKYGWIMTVDWVLLVLTVELHDVILDVSFLILEDGSHSYAHLLHG